MMNSAVREFDKLNIFYAQIIIKDNLRQAIQDSHLLVQDRRKCIKKCFNFRQTKCLIFHLLQ